MRFSLFVILLCLFGPVDAKGAARRRRRRNLQIAHPKEAEWCQSELDKNREENLPYWCERCLEDTSQCASPTRTGIDYIKVRVMTGDCDHRLLEWSNCSSICRIDKNTPGSATYGCVPEYRNIILEGVMSLFLIWVIFILMK